MSDPTRIIPRTAAAIEETTSQGLQRGLQLYISRDGITQVDTAFGHDGSGRPLTSDTAMLWLSAGKPLTAALVVAHSVNGDFALDDSLATYIPEFGVHGKQHITIRHLLTHTSGIAAREVEWISRDWDSVIAEICDLPIIDGIVPGEQGAYVPQNT